MSPLDGRELTISVQQSFPSAEEVTSPGGGSWATGTFSFKVTAWYTPGEGYEPNAGVIRANVPAWADIDVVDNDKVIITWLAAERVPDHYSIYYVEAGTWVADGIIRGRKIAEVNGDILTATILVPWTQQGASTQLTGNATLIGSSTVLHDTTANWSTDGTKVGDSIGNTTDGSVATITVIVSDIELTTTALTGGVDNTWENFDEWKLVSTTMLVDDAANFISNGVAVGDYVIMKITGDFAKIVSVDSETKLQTQALTNGDSYAITEAYDVVDNIFVISTFAASLILNPIRDMDPKLRKIMTQVASGRWVKLSYALDSPVTSLAIEIYMMSVTFSDYETLCKYLFFGVRLRITESSESNALVGTMDGYLTNLNHMPTTFKNTKKTIKLIFGMEVGTLT